MPRVSTKPASKKFRSKLTHSETLPCEQLFPDAPGSLLKSNGSGGATSHKETFLQRANCKVKEAADRINSKDRHSKEAPEYIVNEDAGSSGKHGRSGKLHNLLGRVYHRSGQSTDSHPIDEEFEDMYFEDTTVLTMVRPRMECLKYVQCMCENCHDVDNRAFSNSLSASPIDREQWFYQRRSARIASKNVDKMTTDSPLFDTANGITGSYKQVDANSDVCTTADTAVPNTMHSNNDNDNTDTATPSTASSVTQDTPPVAASDMRSQRTANSSSKRVHLKEKLSGKRRLRRSSTLAVENPSRFSSAVVEGFGLDTSYRFAQQQVWRGCKLIYRPKHISSVNKYRRTKPKNIDYTSPLYKTIAGCDYDALFISQTGTSTYNTPRGDYYNFNDNSARRSSKMVTTVKKLDLTTRGSADWIAEVVLITTSLHTSFKAFFDSVRCHQLLDCKGVEYFHIDVSLDHDDDFPEARIVRNWRAAEYVFSDRRRRTKMYNKNDALVPQLLVDGVPVGGWLDLQNLEDDNDLDYLLAREACPNCLMPRYKNQYSGNCRYCRVSWRELVSQKYVLPREVEILMSRNVYNASRVCAPRYFFKDRHSVNLSNKFSSLDNLDGRVMVPATPAEDD
eukprot:Lankesteria_metandrocarpae@DN2843_c0_g1_i1.p1